MMGKNKPMTCSKCGKAVNEPGDCENCLPYNIYASAWLQRHVGHEALRLLMLSQLDELRQLSFEQVKLPLERADPEARIQTLVAALPSGQPVVMLPCLDEKGYKSVVFVVEPSPLKDGHRRMGSLFGLN